MPYIFILLATFIFRIFFALNVGLIDDEAYHWSWSKELMLSYYDHPGMIAWLNYLATNAFGDTLLGIRLTSFIFYSLTIVFTWKLAEDIFDRRVAFFVSQLVLWTPFWGFGGYVNAPEPVFFFFWIFSAWVFWQGIRPDNKRWSVKTVWLILGVTMGLGLNSKFIMAMLAFGFGVFLLSTPNYRRMLLSPWPWVGVFIATLICLPIFIWNIEFDWPGFKYQFHGRHTGGGGFSIQRWLQWFATQFLFYTPPIYLLILGAIAYSVKHFKDLRIRFLFSLFIPSLVVFYIQPLFAENKPHWSGPATLFMTMIVGYLFYNGFDMFNRRWMKPQSRKWLYTILGCFIALNIVIYSPFVYPFFPKVHRLISSAPWDTRNDLSNEFFGWPEAGAKMLEKQRQIHSDTGKKPFLAAIRYETTAQTIWGTSETVVMLNKFMSHYTVMQKKRNTLDALLGMDSLILTTEKYPDNPMDYALFDRCTKDEFKFYRADEHSRTFFFWFCENFQGVKY